MVRLGQERQKGHLGVSKFADEQIGNRHLGDGPVKGDGVGVLGA